ncbi:pectin methylesterase [Plasmopara halstedii]|uniref:pectinesterase n=1 Tax=Plasmopara halstedii TaxID=4781 RepID=A0A0P1AMJ9_PLAHL|nr:pectin methylesterase [Plasmopara halstedii]CEG42594.1 pectin methylesterase [Plasmopara halstedii]|eukprot:XP_024578963.1 pectin methylesterase [Plasmopara halstedii]
MFNFVLPLAVFATLATPLLAACEGSNARASPADPDRTVVVDKSGAYPGSYKTVAEGISKLNQNKINLFILPGEYKEKLLIPESLDQVVVQGYTCDTTQYKQNTVTITQATASHYLPSSAQNRNFQTSTIGIRANQVKFYNINVANTARRTQVDGQAVAVFAGGKDHGFYACRFMGNQNTVAANNGRIIMAYSYVSGDVDFFFGQKGFLWSEKCDIEVVGDGWITANGNNSPNPESEFVFNRANVFGNGKTFLGRPWQPYSRCTFQNSRLSAIVDSKGWDEWNGVSLDNVYFREYNNNGDGAKTVRRAKFSGILKKAKTINEILGNVQNDFIYDSRFM